MNPIFLNPDQYLTDAEKAGVILPPIMPVFLPSSITSSSYYGNSHNIFGVNPATASGSDIQHSSFGNEIN
jgi:hypothetical protein